MKEGDISHEEVNAGIAAAEKTIIFARQNRLRDGVLLEDTKLRRFQAGHQNVKFFYSAVRQIPEYFLDALLARDISVTLVIDRGLLCFKDVRNWQAIHIGRTRRTIYLPEKLLEVAVNNGYDYWSIAHIVVTQGWQLLDFVLLYELVEAIRKMSLEKRAFVIGYSMFRRLLRELNKHRSSYESPTLKEQRRRSGMDAPINEAEEFIQRYEPGFLKREFMQELIQRSRQRQVLEADEYQVAASSDAMTKGLYDDYYENLWGERKAAELFEELDFPDYFLLDRDIVHPAAREMALAAGQELAPQTMDAARHDFRDHVRFGVGVSMGYEALMAQTLRFGPDGIQGLMEEVVGDYLRTGKLNERLEATARQLQDSSTKPKNAAIYFQRGLDLARFRELLRFWEDVRLGEHKLRLEEFDTIRSVLVSLVAAKARQGDMTRIDVIARIERVQELFDNLLVLIISEAHQLVDDVIQADTRIPDPDHWDGFDRFREHLDSLGKDADDDDDGRETATEGAADLTVQQLVEEELERAVVRVALCLDLAKEYDGILQALVRRGPKAIQVMEEFLAAARLDPEQQIVVVNASRALESAGTGSEAGAVELGEDADILGDILTRVETILEMLPDPYHTATSGSISPLRRCLREFETKRRRHRTDPLQLAHLAMALVRMDRAGNYGELLDQIRWMRHFAVGKVLISKGSPFPEITPGLIMVADAERGDPIGEQARELAEELSGKPWDMLKVPVRK